MIIKRTIGVSASKALAYDYGPGRAQEHHRPHRVAGTCRGTHWRARAAHMDAQLREHGDNRPGSKGRVIRLAVACAPEDRVLSDRQWARIAHQTVDGYTKGRADEYTWEAVRHDARHIHVTLLQRDHDGRLLNLWQDGRRRMQLETQLEREHGLRGPVSERAKALDRSRSRDAVDRRTWKNAKTMQQVRGTLGQQQQRKKVAERDARDLGGVDFGSLVAGPINDFAAALTPGRQPRQRGRDIKKSVGEPQRLEHLPETGPPERPAPPSPFTHSGRTAPGPHPARNEQPLEQPYQREQFREPGGEQVRDGDATEPVLAGDADRAYWKALQPHLTAEERHTVAREGLASAPAFARNEAVKDMQRHQAREQSARLEPNHDQSGPGQRESEFRAPPGWDSMTAGQRHAWVRVNDSEEYQRRIQRGRQRLDDHQIAQRRPRDYPAWDCQRQQAWEQRQREVLREQREREAQRRNDRERDRGRDGPELQR